jgi:Flp pilus assembly protein TadD
LQADSTNAVYWHNFGLLLLQQNRIVEAKPCFEKVLQLQPDNWRVAWGLGEILRRQRKHDSAIVMFRRVAEIHPDFWEAYCAIGIELMRLQENPAALREFNQAIRRNPREPIMYRRLLEIHLLQRDLPALQQVLSRWRRAATPQTNNEIRQWASVLDTLDDKILDERAAAAVFAQMGTWYTARDLEHVATDCLFRAAQLDSTNTTYRERYDTLGTIMRQRLDPAQ